MSVMACCSSLLLMCRDSCTLLLARGDQLKPSANVGGAELLSETTGLENRGFRLAPSSFSPVLSADMQYGEILGKLQAHTVMLIDSLITLCASIFFSFGISSFVLHLFSFLGCGRLLTFPTYHVCCNFWFFRARKN